MNATRTTLAAALIAGALLMGTVACADDYYVPGPPPTVSLTQAIAAAEKQTGGRAVEAELERDHGNTYYEVKVVKDGWRNKVYVDAMDGRVLPGKPRPAGLSRLWQEDDDDD